MIRFFNPIFKFLLFICVNYLTKKLSKKRIKFALITFIMGVLRQIAQYFFIRKPDADQPKTKWIGYMHWINRTCFFIFILCLIILAVKLLRH